jgi:hypothetical protein
MTLTGVLDQEVEFSGLRLGRIVLSRYPLRLGWMEHWIGRCDSGWRRRMCWLPLVMGRLADFHLIWWDLVSFMTVSMDLTTL